MNIVGQNSKLSKTTKDFVLMHVSIRRDLIAAMRDGQDGTRGFAFVQDVDASFVPIVLGKRFVHRNAGLDRS